MRTQSLFTFSNPFKPKQTSDIPTSSTINNQCIEANSLANSLTNICLIREANLLSRKSRALPSYEELYPNLSYTSTNYNDPAHLPTYCEATNAFLYNESLDSFNELSNREPSFLKKIAEINQNYLSIKYNQNFFKVSLPAKFYGKENAIQAITKHRIGEEKNKSITEKKDPKFQNYNEQIHDLAIQYFKYLSDPNYKNTMDGKKINSHPALHYLSTEFAGKLHSAKKISKTMTNHLLKAAHETIINRDYKNLAIIMKNNGLVTDMPQQDIYLPHINSIDNFKTTLKQQIDNYSSPIFLHFMVGQRAYAASVQLDINTQKTIFKIINLDNSISEFNDFNSFIGTLEETIKSNNLKNSLPIDQVIFQKYYKENNSISLLDS